MKKFLLTMATGAIALSAFATPIFAAKTDEHVTIGYTDGAIPNPDKPTDPDWTVTIPKGFNFTKASIENKNMDVILNEIAGKDVFPVDRKVQIDVTSANTFKLVNETNAKKGALTYELTYGDVKMAKSGTIGDLTAASKTIKGSAVLTEDLANIDIDGSYQDTLTYTIHSSVAK